MQKNSVKNLNVYRLLLAFQIFLTASLGFSAPTTIQKPNSPNLENYSTAVFQAPGLNGEGLHPIFYTHSTNTEIAQALAEVYPNDFSEHIFVLVPDTMSEQDSTEYLESLQNEFTQKGLKNLHMRLITVPVHEMLEQSTPTLAATDSEISDNSPLSEKDRNALLRFRHQLQQKLDDLKTWAHRVQNWRTWKNDLKDQWQGQTTKEKDKSLLILFGAARGLPGLGIYAQDAGTNIINIARMAIAYAADIFFTVAPQKLANLPTKMRLPELKSRTQAALSLAASLGLMSIGYFGTEADPSQIHFQISQSSAYVKEWFDRNIELKSFLLNYSLSLGIPLTFLTLGYYAKGGDGSGALSPFDISFLLEFAGLQLIDGFMGMFAGRGTRVITEKGYISGRQENILYSIFNVLGQAQGLGVATGHPLVYKTCLAVKSVLQGLVFFASRVVPARTPHIFIFHSQISARDQESFLYVEGILDPQKVNHIEQVAQQVHTESSGMTWVNQILNRFGQLFIKNQWSSEIIERGHRCENLSF